MKFLFRIDFFEPELLHPASLDFVAALPNLTNLKIINPTVIGIRINPISVNGINSYKLLNQGFVKGEKICLNPYFVGWL